MLTAVTPPPATGRLLVGSLCLCACSVPVFVFETGSTSDSESSESTAVLVTTGDDTTGGSTTVAAPNEGSEVSSDVTSLGDDLPEDVEPPPQCQLPGNACDAEGDDLGRALGLGCGTFVPTAPLAVSGAEASVALTTGLGGPFAPRLGSHAVILSTGVAAEVAMTVSELAVESECAIVGLPCPSTDFPSEFDLGELPLPLDPEPAVCPEGQPAPDAGDCSNTVAAQWASDPQIAHDYTELRFSAEVPENTIALSLSLAFLTAERPARWPTGYNDFLIVWLDSEQWSGNIAIHPTHGVPIAADVLSYDYTGADPEIAGFAFAEHAATDWFTIEAPVVPGETITMVIALFDEVDGIADSAVLLDDLRWTCNPVNLGGEHP